MEDVDWLEPTTDGMLDWTLSFFDCLLLKQRLTVCSPFPRRFAQRCAEGKTDYYARKRLVTQAKNKYNSPKYRLVVRITNADIIVQVIYAKLQGDICLAAAYAHELPKYGVKVGLTNWSAAYCTGLLAARRVLTKLGLADKYEGKAEADGESFQVEEIEDGPRPFKAFLDVGLRRTTTGNRVFGALKGAVDGGVFVPHGEKRFPGYDREKKAVDTETLRKYIYGGHVKEYMEFLEDDDEEQYKKHFSKFLEEDIGPDELEDMYKEAHAKIRAEPAPEKKERKELTAEDKAKLKKFKQHRLNLKQRRDRVKQKKVGNTEQKAGSRGRMDC
jgi:large subunit ribosomal protein L5e